MVSLSSQKKNTDTHMPDIPNTEELNLKKEVCGVKMASRIS